MSDQLSPAFFNAHLHQSFRVTEFPDLTLELVSVEESRYSTAAHPAFSLMFQGPLAPALEQRIYALERAGTVLEIFLVPVARDAGGLKYEAVFN